MPSPRPNALEVPSLGVGIGLRRPHTLDVLNRPSSVGWLEFTPENFMRRGGAHLRSLQAVAERYPMVAHGVGASLGTPGRPTAGYLAELKRTLAAGRARWASDHLCYTTAGRSAVNELLPLPFTEEAVRCAVRNIRRVQDAVGIPWLVENISYYATIDDSEMDEATFIRAVVEESGCGLLLDVNNVWVNAHNQGYDASAFIRSLPLDRVVQVHLAGHDRSRPVFIDTHGEAVQDEVWRLFDETVPLLPACSVLIEWDHGIPPFERLEREAARASTIVAAHAARSGREDRREVPGPAPIVLRARPRGAPAGLKPLQSAFAELLRSSALRASPSRSGRARSLADAPGLPDRERAALMRIPDDRLAIYHDLVVGGHRGMIGNVFAGTLAALATVARHQPALARGTSHRELVEGFIEDAFAATHSLRELADRFLGWLEGRHRAAFRSVPLLGELGRFERLELDVDLVEDGPGQPATTESLSRLASATIGRLLRTRVLVPAWLRMLPIRHDVAAAKALLAAKRADAVLDEIVRPLDAVVVVTRNPSTLIPVNETVPRATARDLRRFRAGAPFEIEQLAALRAPRGPRGETEKESLERVVSETFGWLARGVLVFEPSRPAARARRSRPTRAASAARP